jgi:uncharacterized lipoprotein YmbA
MIRRLILLLAALLLLAACGSEPPEEPQVQYFPLMAVAYQPPGAYP